jgi:hypothetical protein
MSSRQNDLAPPFPHHFLILDIGQGVRAQFYRKKFSAVFSGSEWRHDTQPNDTTHNDTQHNDTQHSGAQHYDIQHDDTKYNNAK